VTVIQLAVDAAIQAHDDGVAVTPTLPEPPALPNARLAGSMAMVQVGDGSVEVRSQLRADAVRSIIALVARKRRGEPIGSSAVHRARSSPVGGWLARA
jgi:hypothetical protein